jgi:hypothetical protein
MIHPVSTPGFAEGGGGAVSSGAVGGAIDPQSPKHTDPCAGNDADRMGVIATASAGGCVAAGRPKGESLARSARVVQ